jgi:hypothetical protein
VLTHRFEGTKNARRAYTASGIALQARRRARGGPLHLMTTAKPRIFFSEADPKAGPTAARLLGRGAGAGSLFAPVRLTR